MAFGKDLALNGRPEALPRIDCQSVAAGASSAHLHTNEAPLVTVIVFVLNAVATIEKALLSVTSGDQPPAEILVLDGGSTDGTVDVIRKFDSKIAFWRSYPDGHASTAVNEGVRRATGDIICLLPADDWIEPGALKEVCRVFSADPDLDVLSCGTRIVSIERNEGIRVEAEFLSPALLEFRMENVLRYPLTAGRFMRRRVYLEVGDYDPQFGSSNDLDFLIRVMKKKRRSAVLPRLVYTYRRHPGSQTISGHPRMVMTMMKNNIRVAERHLGDRQATADFETSLRGLHGRSSARLIWMLAVRVRLREACEVLVRALRVNPLLPLKIFVWLAQKSTGHVPR